MTTSLKVLTLAPEEQSAHWLNLLEQAGFAIEVSRYDSLEILSRSVPAQTSTWQLVLLSDTLPGLSGPPFPALKTYQSLFPHTPAILIAERPTLLAAVAAIKAGANGYLAANDLATLGETVREALAEAARLEAVANSHRQENAHYRQMFENNSAVKLLINPATGAVVDANEAACRFYGYDRADLVKLNINNINTLSPEEVKAEMAKAESEQRLYFEFRHRDSAGAIHDVEVRSSPLNIDGKRLLYSVVHDITERKQMEKAQGFMMTLGHLLNSTFKYDTILNEVAWASVPSLADVCLIFLLQPDNTVKLQVLAAPDRADKARFTEWLAQHPISRETVFGIAGALNGHAHRLVKQVNPGSVAEGLSEAELDCYRALGINSSLAVSFGSRNEFEGIIVFVYGASGRAYSEVDVLLAEGVSRRVTQALTNARHYEEARQAAAAEMATRQELENLARLLAQQADELGAIIEAIPDGIFICDLSGELTRLNPRAIDILGLNDADDPVASYKQLKVFYPDGRPVPREERPLVQALRGVTNTDFREMINHGITGQAVQVRVSFAPIRASSGEIRGGVAIVSDVTELQRLEKQKDEFLTIASHELKTPITSIKGLTQLAIRRLKKAGITNEVSTLQSVEKQVDRMIELISDMLDTRRIQHGRLELQFRPFDLAALVRETSQALQATTSNHTINVVAPIELTVTGDSHRLEQVLNNLLTNAIKYSPKGGPIEVKLAVEEGMAVVSVRDHGIGIPEQDRPNLFQPFHRASNVSLYEVAGFGLGLYLCGEIMKAHQGRLWLEEAQALEEPPDPAEVIWAEQAANSGVTVPESGSTFCISLPLNLPPD
ncbi:MAG: PAS domain S-box protein [Chloroflexi bacterium]|nr:PAS domain S-box protein [Chloroflexota bacterium]OJV88762.1 MAG: hypothetical protein BGO39_04475 [Chloroflexi bacterium 54-19]